MQGLLTAYIPFVADYSWRYDLWELWSNAGDTEVLASE